LVPCNLLLLDEASNHLDAATINALTTALQVSALLLALSSGSWLLLIDLFAVLIGQSGLIWCCCCYSLCLWISPVSVQVCFAVITTVPFWVWLDRFVDAAVVIYFE